MLGHGPSSGLSSLSRAKNFNSTFVNPPPPLRPPLPSSTLPNLCCSAHSTLVRDPHTYSGSPWQQIPSKKVHVRRTKLVFVARAALNLFSYLTSTIRTYYSYYYNTLWAINSCAKGACTPVTNTSYFLSDTKLASPHHSQPPWHRRQDHPIQLLAFATASYLRLKATRSFLL